MMLNRASKSASCGVWQQWTILCESWQLSQTARSFSLYGMIHILLRLTVHDGSAPERGGGGIRSWQELAYYVTFAFILRWLCDSLTAYSHMQKPSCFAEVCLHLSLRQVYIVVSIRNSRRDSVYTIYDAADRPAFIKTVNSANVKRVVSVFPTGLAVLY